MNERGQLVHLAGYASIASVLATAEWSGPLAGVLVLPLVLGTLYFAGDLVIRRLTQRARADLEAQRSDGQTPATDGGQEQHRQTATGDARNRHE